MRGRVMLAVGALAVVVAALPAAAAPERYTDPAGDVYDVEQQQGIDFPHADITSYEVDYNGIYLRLAVEVAEPTAPDPASDPAWLELTGALLLMDPDLDGMFEYLVNIAYDNNTGVPVAIAVDEQGAVTCAQEGGVFDGQRYLARLAAACFGSPSTFAHFAGFRWDVDGAADDFEAEYIDSAPEIGEYTTTAPQRFPIDRVAGGDRIETAVVLSRRTQVSSTSVYLARADLFADAVAAGSLIDGPVLLVPSCGDLPAVVLEEIQRLDPERVVGLGGPAAVCDAILEQAADTSTDEAANSRGVERLAGADRYGTAVAISQERYADERVARVYLARGDDLADSIAAGGLSEGPVLLVPPCGQVPDAVTEEIERLAPDEVTALGGPAAVCDTTLTAVARGRPTDRIAGASRFETAVLIAAVARRADSAVYLANGDTLVDALAAGTIPQGIVLLVPPCGPAPDEVRRYLQAGNQAGVTALGGPAAVCDDVIHDAAL